MRIVTLTTDMGLTDYYVAVLKGNLYQNNSDITLVDITHHVKPFEIGDAAYHINASFHQFPEGTIHLIGVDCEPIIHSSNPSLPSIMLYKKHYFVANDNGIFSLILNGDNPEKFWKVDNIFSTPTELKFPLKNIFVPIVKRLVSNEDISTFATEESTWNKMLSMAPVFEENQIKGSVIHIDYFGNVITNITKKHFDKYGDAPFTLYLRKKEYYIDVISPSYNHVTAGERLAIFNDNGLLEIAVNRGASNNGGGGAATLLGISINDTIRIEFNPPGSAKSIQSFF